MAEGGYAHARHDNFDNFFASETLFHLAQVSACENKKLISLYKNLKANSMFYYKIVCDHMVWTQERYDESIVEHNAIVHAIESFELKLLKESLKKHTENSISFIYESSSEKFALKDFLDENLIPKDGRPGEIYPWERSYDKE